jgi:hypothetical protein
MNEQAVKTISTILVVLGIILLLAGPGFNFISEKPATFAGIVCFIISAFFGRFFKKKE